MSTRKPRAAGPGRRYGAPLAAGALALIALAVGPAPAFATPSTNYYASPGGAGSGCTSGNPCALATALAAAASSANAGTDVTIELAGGSYPAALTISGGSESALTLDGAEANQPSGGASLGAVDVTTPFVTTLESLSITGGLTVANGSNVTLEDSYVTNGGTGITNSGTLAVLDSTVAGSAAGVSTSGPTSIYGSTIAHNSGDGVDVAANTTRIGASVLASNGADCAGTLTSEGYNYADDVSCGAAANDSASLAVGYTAANGGPTETSQLPGSSAGYDVVPTSAALLYDPNAGTFCAGSDQRGVPRTQGPASGCSAGAYQYAPPVVTGVSPRAALDLGLPVTLSGYGLGDVSSASFGSTAATIIAETSGAVSLTVPLSLALGSQPITVSNADGSAVVAFGAIADPGVAAALAPGQLMVPYSQSLAVAGGAGPYTFAETSGALPAGLILSSAGVVSGTPTKAGGTAFGVEVADANGFVAATVNVSLVIATPVIAIESATVKLKGMIAPVTLSCQAAPCSGTARMTESVKQTLRGHVRMISVVLASTTFTLTAGERSTIPLTLTPVGRRVLAHAKKHQRDETLSVSAAGATPAAKTARVS